MVAGLSLLTANASFALEAHPANRPGEALKVWPTSNVAQSCGTAIPRTVLQQDVETQLRLAGIAVSRVHTAVLTADVDCVPVIARGRTTRIAVNQCLDLSQRVSSPSQVPGMTIGTTWRKCQSDTCGTGHCEAKVRSGLRGLVDAFITEFGKSNSAYELPAQPTAPTPPAIENLTATALAPNAAPTPAAIFYLLYIMICTAVLVRWEYSKLRLR